MKPDLIWHGLALSVRLGKHQKSWLTMLLVMVSGQGVIQAKVEVGHRVWDC